MPSLPPREPSKRPSERARAASPSAVDTDPLPPSSRRRVVIRKIQPRPASLVTSDSNAPIPLVTHRAVNPPHDSAAPPSSQDFHVKPLASPNIEPVGFEEGDDAFFAEGDRTPEVRADDEDEELTRRDSLAIRRARPEVAQRRQKLVRGVAAVLAFAAGIAIVAGGQQAGQALRARGGSGGVQSASMHAHLRAHLCDR